MSFGLNLKSALSEMSVLNMLFHHDSSVPFEAKDEILVIIAGLCHPESSVAWVYFISSPD